MNDRPETTPDEPGAPGTLPPLLILGTALSIGLALGRWPQDASAGVRRRLGVCGVAAGVALAAASVAAVQGSRGLVTTGTFAYSRNPAYVGATSIYIGVALYTGSLPALTFLPIALALIDGSIVDREERDLERSFSDAFRAYRAATPRWFSLPK